MVKWSYFGVENDPGLLRTGDHLGMGRGPDGAGRLCYSMDFCNHVVNSKTSYQKQ